MALNTEKQIKSIFYNNTEIPLASSNNVYTVNVSISRFGNQTQIITGLVDEESPFKFTDSSLRGTFQISDNGIIYVEGIQDSGSYYDYIQSCSSVDVYIYGRYTGWVKTEITSFPYNFQGGSEAVIFIPTSNNANINVTYYED